MDIVFLLIPLSVLLVFLIGFVFWWSLRSGQFDDMEGPGYRILMDDDHVREKAEKTPADESTEKTAEKTAKSD